jgi:hypothetical protein
VCNCKFLLEEVSTTCDSGWVVNRYGTHPLSQVVLTSSKWMHISRVVNSAYTHA